jgi:BirA family biotin operon repressor/biotin-[acetyl-CoA-carboxylase] ligase
LSPNTFNLIDAARSVRPFRLHFFSRLRSTNDHATVMRRQKRLYAPAIVLAGSQTAGRGRGSNVWWSGKGSLTVTFALPVDSGVPPHRVPLIAGLAVRRGICEVIGTSEYGQHIRLKWPNDLWAGEQKIAGLLCERIGGVDLVGVGLNVNPDTDDIPSSLRPHVTSLRALTGTTFPLGHVLGAIASAMASLLLDRAYASYAALLREYESVHVLQGRKIAVHEPGEPLPVVGRCAGLDSEGRLRFETSGRVRPINAGTVRLA